MLKRKFRLPARQKLQRPQTRATPYFICRYAPNGLLYSRFGFVVSKAIDKHAVVRNRTRRVLRSFIEEKLNTITPGYDFLFILRRTIAEKTPELEKLVSSTLGGLTH